MLNLENKCIKEKDYFETCDIEILNEVKSFIEINRFAANDAKVRRQANHLAYLIIESLCNSIEDYNRDFANEVKKLPIPYFKVLYIRDEGTIVNNINFVLFRDAVAHKYLKILEKIEESNMN